MLGAIRHFDQRGFGAAPAPQPQPHLARSYFPQPAFHAATALAPLEAVTTPAPARCKAFVSVCGVHRNRIDKTLLRIIAKGCTGCSAACWPRSLGPIGSFKGSVLPARDGAAS